MMRRKTADKHSRPQTVEGQPSEISSNYARKERNVKSRFTRNICVVLAFTVCVLIWKVGESRDVVHVPPLRPTDPVLIQKPSHSISKKAPVPKESLKAEDGEIYHVIFSTDCSKFQHWQSYLFFHSALAVKQPGYVTRIASGCDEQELIEEREWHEKHIQNAMSDQFRIHFTPRFSGVKDADGNTVGDYKFFNKPFGLKHWLEFGELMGLNGDGGMINEDDIVILTDPDMLLMRPITGDFSVDKEVVLGRRQKINRKFKVKHGQPFAQTYGFGQQWHKLDLAEIAGKDSPAIDVSKEDGLTSYAVGPPYIATARDMYAIAENWVAFVPRVHKEYPHLLAEMFAFCIAAAHLKLPHQMIDSLMVSNTGAGGEGWPLIDTIPIEDVCRVAKDPQDSEYGVPSTIHFCQRYSIGEWFFTKRKMVKDYFTCESPLMMVPPDDTIEKHDYKQPPNGDKRDLNEKERKREGFAVCGVISALNKAGKYFKSQHCNPGNFAETLDLANL